MLTFIVSRHGELAKLQVSERDAAATLRREKRLCTGAMINEAGHRCLFGVLEGWRKVDGKPSSTMMLTNESRKRLWPLYLRGVRFEGTEEARCRELARRLYCGDF